jgi:hypothetical protein
MATRSAKARRWQSPAGVSETDAEGSRENKEAQKYTKNSASEFFVLLRAFLWLKISDLSFHYSPESKGIEICNGIVTSRAPTQYVLAT